MEFHSENLWIRGSWPSTRFICIGFESSRGDMAEAETQCGNATENTETEDLSQLAKECGALIEALPLEQAEILVAAVSTVLVDSCIITATTLGSPTLHNSMFPTHYSTVFSLHRLLSVR